MTDDRRLLDAMVEYYRARAPEYDEWFERRGRYDRGQDHSGRWEQQVEQVTDWFHSLDLGGDILELAGGTGWWTQRLAAVADRLTVIDASPETLEHNRARVGRPDVDYVVADLFDWQPDRNHDLVFFSFWMSHVPPERFDPFWSTVRDALAPGGRAVFIDNLPTDASGTLDHQAHPSDDTLAIRKLNDGAEFTIVKVFYDLDELARSLDRLGWSAEIGRTEEFFFHGVAAPR